jgi:hypothetical protein
VDEPVDRRGFIAAGLGAGALALSGCGGAATRQAARKGPPRRYRIRPPAPRRLAQAIRGHVFTRGAPGFLAAAHVYDRRFDDVLPDAVARPVDVRDVRDAVRWGVAHGVRLRARSGGHSYAGYSTLRDGVVLDLRRAARARASASPGSPSAVGWGSPAGRSG